MRPFSAVSVGVSPRYSNDITIPFVLDDGTVLTGGLARISAGLSGSSSGFLGATAAHAFSIGNCPNDATLFYLSSAGSGFPAPQTYCGTDGGFGPGTRFGSWTSTVVDQCGTQSSAVGNWSFSGTSGSLGWTASGTIEYTAQFYDPWSRCAKCSGAAAPCPGCTKSIPSIEVPL